MKLAHILSTLIGGHVLLVSANGAAWTMQPLPIINTNYFFLNDTVQIRNVGESWVVDELALLSAKVAVESRPSVDDPLGNWGQRAMGLQLSIRFGKGSYAVGDQVDARVILRNLSERPQPVARLKKTIENYRISIIKKPEKDLQPLKTHSSDLFRRSDTSFNYLYPGFQHVDSIFITDQYEFKEAGLYYVIVSRILNDSTAGRSFDVTSGAALLTIVGQASFGEIVSASTATSSSNQQAVLSASARQDSSLKRPDLPISKTATHVAARSAFGQRAHETAVEKSNSAAQAVPASGQPLLAEAGSNQVSRGITFGIILLASLGAIALILFRASSRNRAGKPRTSP